MNDNCFRAKLIRGWLSLLVLLTVSVLLTISISGRAQDVLALRFLTPLTATPRPPGMVGLEGASMVWPNCPFVDATFPPGSVAEPVITTCGQQITDLTDRSGLRLVGVAFDLGIWGTGPVRESIVHFDPPITLRINYTSETVEHEERMALYYYDPATDRWQSVPSKVQPSLKEVEIILSQLPANYGEGSTLFALFEPGLAETPVTRRDAIVNVPSLRVRGGPGTMYPIIGGVRRGDALNIQARTDAGDWLQVQTPQGRVGWVGTDFLQLNIPLGSIPPAEEIPPTPAVQTASPTLTPTPSSTSAELSIPSATPSITPAPTLEPTATSPPISGGECLVPLGLISSLMLFLRGRALLYSLRHRRDD